MQAHILSGVVMDVAALKVSHCVGVDMDATTLQPARARSSSIRAMERYMLGFDSAQNSRSPANSEQTSEAMDESSKEQLKRRAHFGSLIRVHVGVDQPHYAIHSKSSTLPGKASARNVQSGH